MCEEEQKTECEYHPKCPACGWELTESEDLGHAGLITYHGEDGEIEYECGSCGVMLAIEETVIRNYDTRLITVYYELWIYPKDKEKAPYVYEKNTTHNEKSHAEQQQKNVQNLIDMYAKGTNEWEIKGTWLDIEKFEIKKVVVKND